MLSVFRENTVKCLEVLFRGTVVSFLSYPCVSINSTNLQIYKELTLDKGVANPQVRRLGLHYFFFSPPVIYF